jgi:PhzF family phenazine biosynthesis protein
MVELRNEDALSFRAPEFLRFGAADEETLVRAITALRIDPGRVVRASWIDNGPGWLGLQLASAADVLALEPDFVLMQGLEIGVIGPYDDSDRTAIGADHEVRAFCPGFSVPEDPVTGSLNAGFAVWLIGAGQLPGRYVARQGTAIGRDGRVRITTDEAGDTWVGGVCGTVVSGTLEL